MMPHGHGVDNCSLRFCRTGRQLDLGESRSLTQICQQNLMPALLRLWAYVCEFRSGADGEDGNCDDGDGDVGNGDGVGDDDHSTRST